MADKTRLREFQAYLADRLSTAADGAPARTWLAVAAGGQHWLIDLADGGEIVQSPEVTPVPMTRPWFVGLANVRGTLFAVSDFSAFTGGRPLQIDQNCRLVLVGSRHGANVGLLVERILGLRAPDEFSEGLVDADLPAWGATQHVDKHGTVWHRLAVRELLADPAFMNIGA